MNYYVRQIISLESYRPNTQRRTRNIPTAVLGHKVTDW